MLVSRSLGLVRTAALRTPLAAPRALAIRTQLQAPRVIASLPTRRWNHQDQSGSSDKKPPTSKNPNFPRPPTDESSTTPKDAAASEPSAAEVESQPKRPLPDLRQGLPSTFEEEFLKGKRPEQEAAPEEPDITDADSSSKSSGGPGRGDIPKSAYESSIDRRRNRIARFFYISLVTSGFLGAFLAGRDWESEEEEKAHPDAPSGWGFMLWYKRIQARIKDQMGYYTEPTFPKLLPDKTGQLEQLPPYTLVLSLENLLVHEEWTREGGWKIAKRPGLDFFLMYLSRMYEICLFTSVPSAMADPILKKLDPYHFIFWPLFREATRYENGDYVKDLAYLNRPLEKTILVDTKASHAKAQPDNAIVIPPWNGDPNDRELLALIPFLEYIPMFNVTDVREVIKSFEGKDVAIEFAKREELMRERVSAASKSKLSTHKAATSSGGFLSKVAGSLGMKQPAGGPGTMVGSDGIPINLLEEMASGKTIFDIYREQNMRDYRHFEKQIRENGEQWLKEEAEQLKQLEAEEIKKMKGSFFGMFSGGNGSDSGAAAAGGKA